MVNASRRQYTLYCEIRTYRKRYHRLGLSDGFFIVALCKNYCTNLYFALALAKPNSKYKHFVTLAGAV